MRRLLFIVPVFFLVAACGERPTAVEEDMVAPLFKKVVTGNEGTLEFTGSSTFDAFLPRTGEWFMKDYRCDAEATLTFTNGYDFELFITEYPPCDDGQGNPRSYPMAGKMTPSGALKLFLPEFFVPVIMDHTGCTRSGTFPVYHGSFDGEILAAVGEFHGLCGEGSSWTDPNFDNGDGVDFPDGYVPVNVSFGFDLNIVPPAP